MVDTPTKCTHHDQTTIQITYSNKSIAAVLTLPLALNLLTKESFLYRGNSFLSPTPRYRSHLIPHRFYMNLKTL